MIIDEIPLFLPEGSLCLVAPSTSHIISVFDNSIIIDILIRRSTFDDIMFNVLRTDSIISNFFMDSLYSRRYLPYISFNLEGDCYFKNQIIDMYLEQFGNDLFSDYIISSMMVIFFAHLNRSYSKSAQIPKVSDDLSKEHMRILSYILDHYSNCSLEQIAQNFNYSASYCSKLIKNITGYNYIELITAIRLRRAESMLSSTHMTIAAISENLGYKNTENFFRVFKKHFGITPAQYRQKLL